MCYHYLDGPISRATSIRSTALSAFATSLNAGLVCRSYTYGHARGVLDVRSHPSDIREQSAGQSDVVSGEVDERRRRLRCSTLSRVPEFSAAFPPHNRGPQSVFAENIRQSRQLLHNLQHHASPAGEYGQFTSAPRNGGAAFQAQQHSIQAIVGHTAHRVSSNSVEVPS